MPEAGRELAPRVVLLDVMGTMLELLPPAPILRELLERQHGIAIDEASAERGFAEEIAYYRTHHCEGRDEATLVALRARCLQALRRGLGAGAAASLDDQVLGAAMLASLRFRPYPEVPGALSGMRACGLRLVAVSNWDASLPSVLEEAGLERALDGVVTSAQVGHPKPAPEIFRAALSLAGVQAAEAVHVGDSVALDVEGARGAGIASVLLARAGAERGAGAAVSELAAGVPVVASLDGLAAMLGAGARGEAAGYPERGAHR